MNIPEAINKAVRAFYDGKSPVKLSEAQGEIRYTKKYFDDLEEEIVPKTAKEKKKNKNDALSEVEEGDDGFI